MTDGPNADRVLDRLWVGGDLSIEDEGIARGQLEALYDAGVRQIVDCRIEWDDREWVLAERPDVDYRWLGVDDAGQTMPDEWFETGTSAVLEHLEGGGASLVHCHMGINRGPSLGFAVLLSQGWDVVEAIAAIREARPISAVAYAEDALRWHHAHTGTAGPARRHDRARLKAWRKANPLDVVRIIAQRRRSEGR